jgi:hypothetical protein
VDQENRELEEVVAARRWEQPQVDRENRELEEATTTMANVEASVARDMTRYEDEREVVVAATRAAEAAMERACWDVALAEGQERR